MCVCLFVFFSAYYYRGIHVARTYILFIYEVLERKERFSFGSRVRWCFVSPRISGIQHSHLVFVVAVVLFLVPHISSNACRKRARICASGGVWVSCTVRVSHVSIDGYLVAVCFTTFCLCVSCFCRALHCLAWRGLAWPGLSKNSGCSPGARTPRPRRMCTTSPSSACPTPAVPEAPAPTLCSPML